MHSHGSAFCRPASLDAFDGPPTAVLLQAADKAVFFYAFLLLPFYSCLFAHAALKRSMCSLEKEVFLYLKIFISQP